MVNYRNTQINNKYLNRDKQSSAAKSNDDGTPRNTSLDSIMNKQQKKQLMKSG